MLFHIAAKHAAQACPATGSILAGNNEIYDNTVGTLTSKEVADRMGVTVRSATVDGPGHTIYLTVEAKGSADLSKFLGPLKVIGDCDITPVTDL